MLMGFPVHSRRAGGCRAHRRLRLHAYPLENHGADGKAGRHYGDRHECALGVEQYQIALTLIRDKARRTIAIGVTSMLNSQTQYTDWGALFAAVVILMLMSFIIYVCFQRYITAGVTIGAIK